MKKIDAKDVTTTCMEVVGFVCLVVAAFSVGFTLGMAVAGILLVVLGILIGRGA